MTRDEFMDLVGADYVDEHEKAQLSQEDTTPSTADTTSSTADTISRQVAIDAVDAIGHIATMPDGDKCIRRSAVKYTLSMLPSAQPEERTEKRTETHACDLISRQQAIEAVFKEGHGTIKGRLERLPSAQPEWKWTPVSERLPEESGYCIITAHDGVGHRTTFAKFQKKAKSWDLTGARSYWRVIAWMPMPEPYKEGETK